MKPSKKNAPNYKWNYHHMRHRRQPEPYDQPHRAHLSELDAPDGSTVLLLRLVDFNEETGYMLHYAIEAPKGCPMREALEWGELAWDEFWTHKPYLYELMIPFHPGPVFTKLISPAEINPMAMARFRHLGQCSPYDLKRKSLETFSDCSAIPKETQLTVRREYADFMARLGHRFANRKAA